MRGSEITVSAETWSRLLDEFRLAVPKPQIRALSNWLKQQHGVCDWTWSDSGEDYILEFQDSRTAMLFALKY